MVLGWQAERDGPLPRKSADRLGVPLGEPVTIPWQMERAADASGPEATELWRRVENYRHHPLWGPLLDQLWVR